MSSQYGKLISLILLEHFGEFIENVAMYLFRSGPNPLSAIVKYTELPAAKVKLALCVLIKQGFVTFKPGRNEINAEYTLQSYKILLILRYPKYLSHIKKSFGDEAEILLEEFLRTGYALASDVLTNVHKRKSAVPLPEIRDKFASLITAKYLMRYPQPDENEKPVPELKLNETFRFTPPNINYDGTGSDSGIYWCVNFDRFHQDFRDQLLVHAVTRRVDEHAGELIRIVLKQMYARTEPWADVSNPIPFVEIKNIVRKLNAPPNNHLLGYLTHYCTVLEEDECGFVSKVDDSASGQYVINLRSAITQLSWSTLEQLVLEKFHTKAARIFRLIRTNQSIDSDQIQKLAMIPAKESKRLTYQLLEENFIEIQELRNTGASNQAPNKSFTLFRINVHHVVRMALELCYKSLYNAMTRRNYNKQVNKRIIDKKHRVDTIIMSLKVEGAPEQQLTDIEEMITPPEKEMLEKIGKVIKTLNVAELEIDEVIFLFQLFCFYNKDQ